MTLEQTLKQLSREGALYEKGEGYAVRCYACGHRCLIKDGRAGVCKVRYNSGGKLFVPFGYAGGIQCDPIEKKPFFHAYPGTDALSFGMLGCDFHCSYCFTPETLIFTTEGPVQIKSLFRRGKMLYASKKASARRIEGIKVYSHTGRVNGIEQVFEHDYEGELIEIKSAFLPPLRVTSEHEFLVVDKPAAGNICGHPRFIPASRISTQHCLAVPRRFSFSRDMSVDTIRSLSPYESTYRVRRKISRDVLTHILKWSQEGFSSKEIGLRVGKSGSHIRHLKRAAVLACKKESDLSEKPAVLVEENGRVRFTKERRPGIPRNISVSAEFAELLGYYCAGGCVVRDKKRVHAATLNFSFGPSEKSLALRTCGLIKNIFGVHAYISKRATTMVACSGKSSVALLFGALCGERGSKKKVPSFLFESKREIVEAFVRGYVAGDGTVAREGQIRISTVSKMLAYGAASLALKLGYLPSFYRYRNSRDRMILGRQIKQCPYVYVVGWYEDLRRRRHLWQDENYWYILVESVDRKKYGGKVYNLESYPEHTYLAPFVSTHNCQNWITSQALRDPDSNSLPQAVDGESLVASAKRLGARSVASTYNEPLITSEWAVHVFKTAKKEGFATAYISNGNGTPEVLDYIRPWVDLYKIDLKSFNDKSYRELGGVLDNVLATVRMVHEKGFWLEIVTLIVPGFNDSDGELTQIAEFLAGVSPDIPWHVTAFHKDYKMTDPDNTSVETLLRAAKIGEKAGLRYVYAGNIPGKVGEYENTRCPACKETLIRRFGFQVLSNRIKQGHCFKCNAGIPGVWN